MVTMKQTDLLATIVVSAALSGSLAAHAQTGSEWAKLPRMKLERQFAGPLQDTVIQRWRDPVDGVVCYIYLPITAAHTPPTPTGFVQYGANTIGSLSCLPPMPAAVAVKGDRAATHK